MGSLIGAGALDVVRVVLGFAAATLAAFVAAFAVLVAVRELRNWTPEKGVEGRAWQGFLIALVLVGFVCAGFGVAQFYQLYTEGWEAIASMLGIVFGGWLGFRGWKLKTAKGTEVDTTGTTEKGGGA